MHRVLERQIKRFLGDVPKENSPQLEALFNAISETYVHADDDRLLLTRSIEISSKEFVLLNQKLRAENEIIEERVQDHTRELERERAKLSEIAKHMSTGTLLLDEKGMVSFVNSAAMRLLGATSADDALDKFVKFFAKVPVPEHIASSLGGKSVTVDEVEVADNIYTLSFASIGSESGLFGSLIWISDITEQTLLERSKNQFITIASHEMRTPLAIIRGNAELMLGNTIVFTHAELTEEAQSILRSAIRMLGIVNDFLDVQNIEGGTITLKRESVDVPKILHETVKDLLHIAAEKGLTLNISPMPHVPPIIADQYRLQQIFINLIANAIHYTNQGGITASVEFGHGTVNISFVDTGVGIEPQDQARIFQKFQTGKNIVSSKEYGSGLGLYISSLLAERMGGSVTLAKTEIGVGSTFVVSLPVQ